LFFFNVYTGCDISTRTSMIRKLYHVEDASSIETVQEIEKEFRNYIFNYLCCWNDWKLNI